MSKPQQYSYSFIGLGSEHEIYAKESQAIELPAPLSEPLQILYFPYGVMPSGVAINVYHPSQLMNVVVTMETTDNRTGEVVQKQSFVTADFPTGVIRIPGKVFEVEGNRVVSISIVNYEDNGSNKEPIDIYERVQVQITTGLYGTLTDYTPIRSASGVAKTFNYYLYTKRKGDAAFMYLRVENGEADLYVRKSGEKNEDSPDLDTFDYSSTSVKNDEIMIEPTTRSRKEADETENFIIGVYSESNSIYSLQVSTNPEFKFLQIQPGQVILQRIRPDRPLLVTMMNPSLKSVTVVASGVNAGVSVWGKPVDENKVFDFQDMLPLMDSEKPLLETKEGHVIQKTETPKVASPSLRQWNFIIKPTKEDDVTFVIEMEDLPATVPIGIGYFDLLVRNQCQNYKFTYDADVFDEKIKISLEQGTISIDITDQASVKEPTAAISSFGLSSNGKPVSKKYQLKEFLGGKDHDISTPDTFNTFYVKICSMSNLTLFGLKTYKPTSKYYALTPSERLTINTKESKTLYYYPVNENTTSIRVKVSLRTNGESGDYVVTETDAYNALKYYYTSSEKFGMHHEQGFDQNDPQSLIQAELKKQNVTQGSVKSVIFSFAVQKHGYFIIKPAPPSTYAHMIRIQFLVNDYRLLPSSGNTYESIAVGKTYTFQITKPATALTRLKMSACKGKVDVTVFEGAEKKKINSFHIGMNFNELAIDQLAIEAMNPTLQDITSSATLIYIEVKTASKETKEALIIFNVHTLTTTENLAIEDYFSHYNIKAFSLPFLEPNFKVVPKATYYDVVAQALEPIAGFEKQYGSFKRVEIHYRVHSSRDLTIETQMALANMCGIDYTDFRRSTMVDYTTSTTLNAVNGVFNWTHQPQVIFQNKPYPDGGLPYIILLQIKMTFFGEDDESEDDDSTIIFKHKFEITKIDQDTTPIQPKKILGLFFAALVFIVVLALGIMYWINKNKEQPAQGKGFQQVGKESEMHRLELEGGDGHKMERADDDDKDETV